MGKRGGVKINQGILVKVLLFFLLFYLLFHLVKLLKKSLFFTKRDRVNIIFYQQRPVFLSLGLTDNVHYLGFFDNDLLVLVPGGYGRYKIGSLGKLASLEKKPAVIQRTFSSITSSYVDLYFYPKKVAIYSSSNQGFYIPRLRISQLIGGNYVTNSNFFDRLYLFFFLIDKNKSNFSLLGFNGKVDEKNRFLEEAFFSQYQGYFYQKSFRQERKKIKIFYNKYSSAQVLNRILEGEGIKVVDLIPYDKTGENCQIIEQSNEDSLTVSFLAESLRCQIRRQKGVGDIHLILGRRLEGEWE